MLCKCEAFQKRDPMLKRRGELPECKCGRLAKQLGNVEAVLAPERRGLESNGEASVFRPQLTHLLSKE
jgi:hypothetical protein